MSVQCLAGSRAINCAFSPIIASALAQTSPLLLRPCLGLFASWKEERPGCSSNYRPILESVLVFPFLAYCRASQTGDAIRVVVAVAVAVVVVAVVVHWSSSSKVQ